MRIISVLIAVFLLTAFAIGIAMTDSDMPEINQVLDNVTVQVTNFTLANSTNNSYANGVLLITEKAVHLFTVSMIETMRIGILFGHDNPDYFTPDFIISLAQFLIWATIISLLFVPMLYLLAFFIMLIIWITKKIKGRKNGKEIN